MKKKTALIFLIYSLSTGLFLIFSNFHWLEWFDLKTYDLLLQHTYHSDPDSNIIVVKYDDETRENYHHAIDHSDLAALIQSIQSQNPKVMALNFVSLFDIVGGPNTSGLLDAVLSQYNNICYGIGLSVSQNFAYLTAKDNDFDSLYPLTYPDFNLQDFKKIYQAEQFFTPLYSQYSSVKSLGHLVLDNEPDGVFRRIPAIVGTGGPGLMSFGIQAAFDYLNIPRQEVRFNNRVISLSSSQDFHMTLDEKGRLFIPNNKRGKIREISMIDVLMDQKHPEKNILEDSLFNNKLVFIGNTSSRTARYVPTSVDPWYPALLIHADAANVVLQSKIVKPIPFVLTIFIIISMGFFTSVLALFCKSPATLLYLLFFLPLLGLGGFISLSNLHVYIPLFTFVSYFSLLFTLLLIYSYFDQKIALVISLRNLQGKIKLNERLAAIGELSAKVAHEIRNPLNGIKLYTSLIKRESTTKEERKEHLNIIEEEVQRLNRFLSTLLSYTRPKNPVIRTVELDSFVRNTIKILQSDLEKKNIFLQIDIPEKLKIRADSDQLNEVFLNLIKNSIEASNQGAFIKIEAQCKIKGLAEIKVKDKGLGIPPKEIKNIFIPYHTSKAKGTGLGLSVVKKIIDAHNGKISVKSTPGEGTEFTLQFKSE